ncbi:M48 family metalloprotease [uncultured Acidaminococcus sp.]|jgi:Zn-dependent protease with chaperone function|uniref:M48 family metalloprotease n=1 Tax=uncultured Acidaminococcus sp. TaxID=352152 RepID=UPI0025EB2BC9|nr:M48 family metalloprotease [uncultured Acidaminococcus sp.]
MVNFILLLIQFGIDYVMLAVHLTFIIPAVLFFTPSSWFQTLRTGGGLTGEEISLILALILIVPALLSRFSFFQSILVCLNGARKAKGDDLAYIESALMPVLQKAGLKREALTLYIQNSPKLNAYAMGDRHIVVYRGLLAALPREEVSGVLAHELGHLAHNDTKWMLLSYGMNVPITIVTILYRAIVSLLRIFLIVPILGLIISLMVFFFNLWLQFLNFFIKLPFRLIQLVKARQDEYDADRYAFEIGYGAELHNALYDISGGAQDDPGFWGRLWSDHPVTQKRLEKLRALVTQIEAEDRDGSQEE